MIHEIDPHKLHNEFLPGQKIQGDDIVICVQEETILVRKISGQLELPRQQDMPAPTPSFIYTMERRSS